MMSQDTKTVAATEAKIHFGDILNQCVYGRTPVVITKHDKPVAILVRFEDWQSRQQGDLPADENEKLPSWYKSVSKHHERMLERLRTSPPTRTYSSVELVRMIREDREQELEDKERRYRQEQERRHGKQRLPR